MHVCRITRDPPQPRLKHVHDIRCSDLVAALVEEMLSALREEVKDMDRTNWLYETQDPQVTMRLKI